MQISGCTSMVDQTICEQLGHLAPTKVADMVEATVVFVSPVPVMSGVLQVLATQAPVARNHTPPADAQA